MESVLAISRGGDIALTVFLFAVGLLLIIKGGDWFVDSASRIAEISGIPSFIIGATVVSLGTTLPELITSAIAAGQGNIDIAIGNAVGSVNANIGLIMAVSLLFMPHAFDKKTYLFKGLTMIAAVVILFLMSLKG
ncbi:MAG: sodium:calcium antiporter, partial [Eubacteriales bacterium]|nr:sodium:calcium antiporter [Eubacteriales bacterium]